MVNKKYAWSIKGIMQDTDDAKFSNQYAFDMRNMRINDTGANNLLAIMNEVGTRNAELLIGHPLGDPVGVISIGESLVLFTNRGHSIGSIYLINTAGDDYTVTELATGEFDFHTSSNVEVDGFGIVENEHLWKVYFNYPNHPLRVLAFDPNDIKIVTDVNKLNFNPSINADQASYITVDAIKGGGGQFPTGSIQYAYRFYKKNGQASGIINISPLEYIYGNPTELASCIFNIHINTIIDDSFPYDSIQIYSLHYNALYATPSAKMVYDGRLSANINVVDNGNIGSVVDVTSLAFMGSSEMYANDIEQKGGRMFVGGITLADDKEALRQFQQELRYEDVDALTYYNEAQADIKPFFMPNNYYRLGVQLLHKNGKWSDVVYINDVQAKGTPVTDDDGFIPTPIFSYKFDTDIQLNDYIAVRPMVVYPNANDRVVVCNAVACPTVYNKDKRSKGLEYSQSSWFWRPNTPKDQDVHNLQGNYMAYADNEDIRGEVPVTTVYQPFAVDAKAVTLHSPDIEFGSASMVDDTTVKCKTISRAFITNFAVERNIETSTPPITNGLLKLPAGFYNPNVGSNTPVTSANTPLAAPYYVSVSPNDSSKMNTYGYFMFPWHHSGSIIGDAPTDGSEAHALLYRNQTAVYRVAHNMKLNDDENIVNESAKCRVVNGGSIYDINGKTYAANCNSVLSFRTDMATMIYDTEDDFDTAKLTGGVPTNESVNMTYESTPHMIIDGAADISLYNTGLPIVEVQQGNIIVENLFGGKSDAALRNNHWDVAGDTIYFNNINDVQLTWNKGDAFYYPYACMKTYAPSIENTNQIVDILNVRIASYINMNGRYDKFINSTKNIGQSPLTYNLINTACSNVTTTTNALSLDGNDNIQSYKNWVAWSDVKENGSTIDTWTNINFASAMEMDGTFGDVESIYQFNNQLIVFQDKSVSRINYNERVMMGASDGVPVAIANSKAVDGYTTLSSTCGCKNKRCICDCPSGLFFMDDINSIPFRYNGQQFEDLSLTHGMKSYFKNKTHYVAKMHYDLSTNDIMYEQLDNCLSFSTTLNAFIGHFPYNYKGVKICYMGKMLDFRDGIEYVPEAECSIPECFVYREGKPNLFYNTGGSDWCMIDLRLANEGPVSTDKIFYEVSWDSDYYNDGTYENVTFDHLLVSTDYQASDVWLDKQYAPKRVAHPLKKKFNLWHALIPRDNTTVVRGRRSDRMRGPWLRLTLEKDFTFDHNPYSIFKVHNIYVDYQE